MLAYSISLWNMLVQFKISNILTMASSAVVKELFHKANIGVLSNEVIFLT